MRRLITARKLAAKMRCLCVYDLVKLCLVHPQMQGAMNNAKTAMRINTPTNITIGYASTISIAVVLDRKRLICPPFSYLYSFSQYSMGLLCRFSCG